MKTYYTQNNIGKAKYVVNYHDGVETHKDGSPFFGIRIFKNQVDFGKCLLELHDKGYKYKRP